MRGEMNWEGMVGGCGGRQVGCGQVGDEGEDLAWAIGVCGAAVAARGVSPPS